MKVEAKHDVLLKSLKSYYEENPDAFAKFKAIIRGETRMSLRVLDWLVTNYAKKHNIVYSLKVGERDTTFNMFLEYKSQLKAYSKRHFDPFCRRGRIEYEGVVTTCGQMAFFRWAIQCGVLEYACEHQDAIEGDMLESIQHRYVHPEAESKRKRKELSKAAIKSLTETRLMVRVRFT
jgi:hypothetical protein